eukprot:g1280.t1
MQKIVKVFVVLLFINIYCIQTAARTETDDTLNAQIQEQEKTLEVTGSEKKIETTPSPSQSSKVGIEKDDDQKPALKEGEDTKKADASDTKKVEEVTASENPEETKTSDNQNLSPIGQEDAKTVKVTDTDKGKEVDAKKGEKKNSPSKEGETKNDDTNADACTEHNDCASNTNGLTTCIKQKCSQPVQVVKCAPSNVGGECAANTNSKTVCGRDGECVEPREVDDCSSNDDCKDNTNSKIVCVELKCSVQVEKTTCIHEGDKNNCEDNTNGLTFCTKEGKCGPPAVLSGEESCVSMKNDCDQRTPDTESCNEKFHCEIQDVESSGNEKEPNDGEKKKCIALKVMSTCGEKKDKNSCETGTGGHCVWSVTKVNPKGNDDEESKSSSSPTCEPPEDTCKMQNNEQDCRDENHCEWLPGVKKANNSDVPQCAPIGLVGETKCHSLNSIRESCSSDFHCKWDDSGEGKCVPMDCNDVEDASPECRCIDQQAQEDCKESKHCQWNASQDHQSETAATGFCRLPEDLIELCKKTKPCPKECIFREGGRKQKEEEAREVYIVPVEIAVPVSNGKLENPKESENLNSTSSDGKLKQWVIATFPDAEENSINVKHELDDFKVDAENSKKEAQSVLISFSLSIKLVDVTEEPTPEKMKLKVRLSIDKSQKSNSCPFEAFDIKVGKVTPPPSLQGSFELNLSDDPCDVSQRVEITGTNASCALFTVKGESACLAHYNVGVKGEILPCRFGLTKENTASPTCQEDRSCHEKKEAEKVSKEMETAITDAKRDCSGRLGCESCTNSESCGWCATDDAEEGSGKCVLGGPPGPLDTSTGQYGKEMLHTMSCTSWEFSFCPTSPCAQHTSCADCLFDPYCGWCTASSTCTEGDTTGPIAGLSAGCRRGWVHSVVPHSSEEQFASVVEFDQSEKHERLEASCERAFDETRRLVQLDIEHEAATNSTWRYQIQTCSPCNGAWPKCDCGGNEPEEGYKPVKVKVDLEDDEAKQAVPDPGPKDEARDAAKESIAQTAVAVSEASLLLEKTHNLLLDQESNPIDEVALANAKAKYEKAKQLYDRKLAAHEEALKSLSLVARGKKENMKELADQWVEALKAEAAAVNAETMAKKAGDPLAVQQAKELINEKARLAAAAEKAMKMSMNNLDETEADGAAKVESRKRQEQDKIKMLSGILNALSAMALHGDKVTPPQRVALKDSMKKVIGQLMKSVKDEGGGEIDEETIALVKNAVGYSGTPDDVNEMNDTKTKSNPKAMQDSVAGVLQNNKNGEESSAPSRFRAVQRRRRLYP